MAEATIDDKVLDNFLQTIHPVLETQDANCPYIKWLGEDLNHCPGVGEYKCMEQKYEYGEYGYGGNFDYQPCNSPNHATCPVYLKTQQK